MNNPEGAADDDSDTEGYLPDEQHLEEEMGEPEDDEEDPASCASPADVWRSRKEDLE